MKRYASMQNFRFHIALKRHRFGTARRPACRKFKYVIYRAEHARTPSHCCGYNDGISPSTNENRDRGLVLLRWPNSEGSRSEAQSGMERLMTGE